MNGIKSRIPALLSECLSKGISVSFDFHIGEPLISFVDGKKERSHLHLEQFIPHEHRHNAEQIEAALDMFVRSLEQK